MSDTSKNLRIKKISKNAPVRKSTIKQSDVISYLQAKAKTSSKPEKIKRILTNIMIDRMHVENYNGRENLISVPLSNQSLSKDQADSTGETPLEFILMVEDENGNLRAGDIVNFFPKDPTISTLPQGFF